MVRINGKFALALGAVWFIWGSTYAAMHDAVTTIPPFLMSGARFLTAGALLYAVCVVRKQARCTAADVRNGFVSGAALLLLGNGITSYTVQYLPTGINALLLSCAPIWMAIIAFVWGREQPTRAAMLGMLLGLVGLALLVGAQTAGSIPLVPALLAIFASVSWAFGSIYSRRVGSGSNLMLATALQMLAGGALLTIAAPLTGEWTSFDARTISLTSLLAFGWLVVFGSIIAYSAYQYLMHTSNTALASTYAYVNPIVSVGLGYLLFGELLTPVQGFASAVIIAGVALMMVRPRGAVRGQPVRPVPVPRSTRS